MAAPLPLRGPCPSFAGTGMWPRSRASPRDKFHESPRARIRGLCLTDGSPEAQGRRGLASSHQSGWPEPRGVAQGPGERDRESKEEPEGGGGGAARAPAVTPSAQTPACPATSVCVFLPETPFPWTIATGGSSGSPRKVRGRGPGGGGRGAGGRRWWGQAPGSRVGKGCVGGREGREQQR